MRTNTHFYAIEARAFVEVSTCASPQTRLQCCFDFIGHLVRDVQQLPLQQAKKYNAAGQSRCVIGIGGFSYPSFSSCDAINVACGDLAADHIFWASVDYGLLI
jgi:hypothetical protein